MSGDPATGTPRDRVAAAMAALPREDFLRRWDRWRAGHDGPVHIGHGQTSSQPSTVADMLVLLDVRPGQRVLDLGCGSGWTTALLARLTGPAGSVLGLERIPDLVDFGSANLARTGMAWARIEAAAPGRLGSPTDGPFDRILVSAQPERLPQALVDQLADGGVLVIPVAGRMLRGRRTGPEVALTEHGHYLFVPLIEGP
jgi:protein-L-isoaspartate(D-aspartate) O-methyltransferase